MLRDFYLMQSRIWWFAEHSGISGRHGPESAAKYPKAVECLAKDRAELLAFYDFPAEHWIHLRTTNPIESTFTTVRHRTDRTKGCLTRTGMLCMICKVGMSAQRHWRALRGFASLAKVIKGVKFRDGIEVREQQSNRRVVAPSRLAA